MTRRVSRRLLWIAVALSIGSVMLLLLELAGVLELESLHWLISGYARVGWLVAVPAALLDREVARSASAGRTT